MPKRGIQRDSVERTDAQVEAGVCLRGWFGAAAVVIMTVEERRIAMTIDYSKARRHLARRDPILKQLISAVGPCTLRYEPDGFAALVRSIVSQQISTRAAASIHGRLLSALGRRRLRPAALLALSDEELAAPVCRRRRCARCATWPRRSTRGPSR